MFCGGFFVTADSLRAYDNEQRADIRGKTGDLRGNFYRKDGFQSMKHLYSHMIPLSGAYTETYFAGANTARGFVSAYPSMIREGEFSRVYILKGGSGTGKSSFMKACAARAEAAGASVTLLLCSSDPASADAVILTGKDGSRIAILDGTAPHTADPALPGAIGEILNLGQFWRTEVLIGARSDIAHGNAKKSAAYARAYRYLAAYGEITAAARALLAECLLTEKMQSAANRLLAAFPRGGGYREEIRYTAAVSMKGMYRLGTFARMAHNRFAVTDAYGCAPFFLEAVRRAAADRHCPIWLSPAPGETEMPLELYLPDAHAAICAVSAEPEETAGGAHTVNMQRFIDRRALAARRVRLRFADRCREMLMEGALDALAEADAAHFSLEEIYKSAMDFDAVCDLKEEIAAQIVRTL